MKPTLFAPLTLLLLAFATPGQSTPTVFNAKHLSKAERLVIQFERFDALANNFPDTPEHRTRLEKLSESLRNSIGLLPESDIKTDFATAIYFYGLAGRAASDFEALRCANQRPGIYQILCANVSGSPRDFLQSKARLHVSWARTNVGLQRSGTLNGTELAELIEQRESDQDLARQALAALKRLEGEVVVYSSLGDFEAQRAIARVPYETFQQHLRETVIDVRRILSWLPRNRLRAEISNALSSYQDGGFWWERVYQPRVINVSNLVAETTRAPVDIAHLETVPYTIIINWRNAGRSLKRAEALL